MRDLAGTVGIIGAGLIGRSWSIVFARAGWRVRLHDAVPEVLEAALERIGASLADLEAGGLVEAGDPVLGRISCHGDLAETLAGVDYVQECGPEVLEQKQSLFRAIDGAAPPDAVIASSSSGITASAFAADLAGRRRCLVVHPVNPPHLVTLVELAPAEWTEAAAVERARAIMVEVGQAPVLVRREIEGFILNRLQGALLSEALRLVEGGYVSPDDLDTVVAEGLGPRWSFMGPFETIDLNAPGGIRDYMARYGPLYGAMAERQREAPNWGEPMMSRLEDARRSRLGAAELGARSRWRDRRLTALAVHKKTQKSES